ncbi:MAG TPA: hypothetical protein VFT74_02550, partial [Isosphaeraceae bacterium]|nr:hypothetical protein [Isosphaeraceae bacterium]
MSTATRKPLTKTKQAQLILEGTAASMAVVLTLWLLLWFLWQSLGTFPVEVLFIPDRDLPFQRADAEAFLGKTDQIESSSGSQILRAVETLVAQPNQPPLLLMISVPAFGVGPDARLGGETGEATVESLIRTVARKAQRKVLLALDLAQIDSDLSRHLYGNSTFTGLEQWLHEESFDDQNQSIWVLCASASGQKSWTADGLGRSIFAYYLEKGISGAARPWDHSPGGGRVVTVEGLARYVRKGVRTWVDEHRSKAIQTPVLMKVGHRSDDFAFSGVLQVVPIVPETKSEDTPKPADPESLARGKSKEGEKAPEKSSPPRPAREILMDDLFQEWGEHDRLRNIPGADPIFRWLPNGWKKYESDLLNAEQLVRASEIDPSLQPSARDAIRQAGDSRRELTNQ